MVVKTQSVPVEGLRLGEWSDRIAELFVAQPDIFEQLPEDFVLATLPQNEPELVAYALDLLPRHSDKPTIYALVGPKSVTFLLPEGPLRAELHAT
jgi:hypothetical protein